MTFDDQIWWNNYLFYYYFIINLINQEHSIMVLSFDSDYVIDIMTDKTE